MAVPPPDGEDPFTPLAAFNFHVHFAIHPGVNEAADAESRFLPMTGISSAITGGFAEVSGLEATMEPKVIRAGGRNYGAYQRAGAVTFGTVVLKRGLVPQRHLWAWWSLFAGGDGATNGGWGAGSRSDVYVVMLKEGTPLLGWRLDNAMPVKFRVGDLNARGGEVAIEELHLVHEGLQDGASRMTALAKLSDVAGTVAAIEVMFNPASLKVAVSNKLQDENSGASGKKGGKPSQNTRVTTTKLDIELTFDTTDTGSDVRGGDKGTGKIRALGTASDGDNPTPPTVEFRWGNFVFRGLIESINETLDFWSDEGVPLRSTVQLSMQQTETVDQGGGSAVLSVGQALTLAKVPEYATGTSGVGSQLGNAGAGRAIAAANGIEDMRMAAGGTVAVSASVKLEAAASFDLSAGAGASASASAGASAGFGIGASASAGASAGIGGSASVGIGASASFGASASAGFGASASAGFGASASAGFSASASAGISASAGAFAGLGASKTASVSIRLDPVRLLPPPRVVTSATPQFDITGKVVGGGSGLDAQLNAHASAGVAFG